MAKRGGLYNGDTVEFDQPSPRGLQFVEGLNAFFWKEKIQVPSQVLEVPFMADKPFGYQSWLTVLSSYYRKVPTWAIDGPPTSRPLAPNMIQPLPSNRVTAARAAFDQQMGIKPK